MQGEPSTIASETSTDHVGTAPPVWADRIPVAGLTWTLLSSSRALGGLMA